MFIPSEVTEQIKGRHGDYLQNDIRSTTIISL